MTSQSTKRKFCRDHFLSFSRMREWVHVHEQILALLKELRIAPGKMVQGRVSKPLYASIHRSVLSGYLSNIGIHKEKNIYRAAKNREATVFPGSTLFNKSPAWMVAVEMIKTSRLFARTAAKINPKWVEKVAGDLCRRTFSSPRWVKSRGEVIAEERVTLFGLEISAGRTVKYGPIDPEESHRIFIRSGLVEGRFKDPPGFLVHNLNLRRKLTILEEKLRRRDILINEEKMCSFYSSRLKGIYDTNGLRRRLRKEGSDRFLRMEEKDLFLSKPDQEELAPFPDVFIFEDVRVPVTYTFAPGEENDGITFSIPEKQLSRIPDDLLEWGIPGIYGDKITALIKGLPKRFRKLLVPVSATANVIRNEMEYGKSPFFQSLASFVKMKLLADIPAEEWARVELPPHLKIRIEVLDAQGKAVHAGREIDVLRSLQKTSDLPLDPQELKKVRKEWEKTGRSTWDFPSLPENIKVGRAGIVFPALAPAGDGAALRLFKDRDEARDSHLSGVQELYKIRFAKDLKFIKRYLVIPEELSNTSLFFGGKESVEGALQARLQQEVFRKDIRSRSEFDSYAETVLKTLFEKGHALRKLTIDILEAYQGARRSVGRTGNIIREQIKKELDELMPSDYLRIYSIHALESFPRYLKAVQIRAVRAKNDPEKERKKADRAAVFSQALNKLQQSISSDGSAEKKHAVEEFRWMIEEYKVSLFAPELKTAFPVSVKRLTTKWKGIEDLK